MKKALWLETPSAIVVGVTLRDRVSVPDNALITTQAQADKLQQVGS